MKLVFFIVVLRLSQTVCEIWRWHKAPKSYALVTFTVVLRH